MKKLVVIDDEFDFCTLVKLQCSKNGIECKCANTLTEGLELVKIFVPDILILDNNLPDGHGWHKADFLVKEYPNISLHLITAKNSFENNRHYLSNTEKKVLHYSKPLTLAQLNNIILQHSE
jgi:two-component system OmpR family response regulator